MIWWTVILGLLLSAVSAWVTLYPPAEKDRRKRAVFFAAFVLLFAALGIPQILQDRETQKTFAGDPSNPPYIDVIDLNPLHGEYPKVVVVNASGYPAFVSCSITPLNGIVYLGNGRPSREPFLETTEVLPHGQVLISEIALGDGKTDPMSSSYKYTEIILHTRSGPFNEQLLLRRLENSKWTRALRLLNTAIEHVDPDFPRNPAGAIDWPEWGK